MARARGSTLNRPKAQHESGLIVNLGFHALAKGRQKIERTLGVPHAREISTTP